MSAWGFFINNDENWQIVSRCVNGLLKQGVPVFQALEPLSADGDSLAAGGFVISNATLEDTPPSQVQAVIEHYGLTPQSLDHGPGGKMMQLKSIKIALYGGGGSPYHHMAVFNQLGFQTEFISDQHIRDGFLEEFDVLLMPGGGWQAMNGQLDPLGEEGAEQVKWFIRQGGMYISSCAGSYDAAIAPQEFIDTCPTKGCLNLINMKVWNDQGKEWVGLESPGIGIWKLKNEAADHPVMFGLPDEFEITHYNGPIFEATETPMEGTSQSFTLASLAGVTDGFTPSEHFLEPGASTVPMEQTLAMRGAKENKGVIVGGYMGFGKVILFGSHPEFGSDVATLTKWGLPTRILGNTLFWHAGNSRMSQAFTLEPLPLMGEAVTTFSLEKDLENIKHSVHQVIEQMQRLDQKKDDSKDYWWLDQQYSMSILGLPPKEIWQQAIASLAGMSDAIGDAIKEILDLKNAAVSQSTSAEIDILLNGLAQAIHYERPAVWNQDGGYQGMRALLNQASVLAGVAEQHLDAPAPDLPVLPYQHFESNPFYLLAGTYLSAISVVLCVQLLLQSFALQLKDQLALENLIEKAPVH